ncbi:MULTISPECIES: hypothetical protein [Mycobacterium]|uniref:Transmembrane protein n=1 Tax=Mycobacterium indicus pranii (strain DSM 45239 / MTCC 9506) TaxID=1232724 RepID=J9W8T3_MYCIP|nr:MULTISPECIES: hypothetical protein [Mycobacterium]AFS12478.1 Hypothetical protein MIP_00701 [Mycobacterium intracellulare subsp. intracellulare MTCC 9506]WSE51091.1 hypothetical protein QGN31_23830 [Mycobacterium sp. 2-64]BCO50057.1 hypothetical protein MINTM003_04980 [Mycobacterium paraintracellulare]BCO87244.1 hypothetical protein MINTM015_05010 [Mycobacterium paraintracellulare]
MGRKVAILWHASFTIAAGFLYFFFVLPRWPELMGDTAHSLGTALRIVTGALVALAALPVVFTLLRTRKPELGTPQMALSIRVASIVAHVLAGVLIVGTAISEIWLSLDVAGRWLFGIYGAAAAIALLGFFAFYLSFVAELPPPPPKPIKAKKPKKAKKGGLRRKKGEEADEAGEAEEADAATETEASEPDETDAATEAAAEAAPDEPAETEVAPVADATEESEEPRTKLQNRRPTGKGSHRMRRRRTRAGTAVDDTVDQTADED